MRKSFLYLMFIALTTAFMTACEKDDSDFSNYKLETDDPDPEPEPEPDDTTTVVTNDTIYIVYDNDKATVNGAAEGEYEVSGADVTFNKSASNYQVFVLSGSSDNGSLLIYREKKYEIILNNVNLTHADGPAINNQCGKSLYINCPAGTVNTLSDGTEYALRDIDQKGALFSEGQIYFRGTGTLNVIGNYKNAIASDDYITVEDEMTLNISSTVGNGLKANDGVFIQQGVLTIQVSADGARGIKCDARTEISGGTTTITTTGDCRVETVDGVTDTTSCACIKSDSLFVMTAGTLTLTSTGDGGKGINCSQNIELRGGTLVATTTGDNDMGKPKALKSDTGIIVSGGSLTATVKKSWALDNGVDSEDPKAHVTIVGTPTTEKITKKSVQIIY